MSAPESARHYWAPSLCLWLFWACAIVLGIAAGMAIAGGAIIDAMVYLFAILSLRVAVEVVIVLFDIRAVLVDIRDKPTTSEQRAKREDARRNLGALRMGDARGEMRLDR